MRDYGGYPGPLTDLYTALNEALPASVAVAATMNIGLAEANTVNNVGSAGNVSSLGIARYGMTRRLVAAVSFTLVAGANILLPGGGNITLAIGDVAEMQVTAPGVWNCIALTLKSGKALVGVQFWSESQATTGVNATRFASSWVPNATTTDADGVYSSKGLGAVQRVLADGLTPGGDKRGDDAVDWQKNRVLSSQVASGAQSTIGGGVNNTASGQYSTVAGGVVNLASGAYSTVGGGLNNQSNGTGTFVGGGEGNIAAGESVIGGGNGNSADNASAIVGGNSNVATGQSSAITGGRINSTLGSYSRAGGQTATDRSTYGADVWSSGTQSFGGQALKMNLAVITTTAAATPMVSDGTTAGITPLNSIALVTTGSTYAFLGIVTARCPANDDAASFEVKGTIRCTAAGVVSIVGAPIVTPLGATIGAAAWNASATADNTNKTLVINAIGQAATTIYWDAYIITAQVVI